MSSALRTETIKALEQLPKGTDVVVGIPSYENESTVAFVVQQAYQGIERYFGGRGCILNSDGGSQDSTQKVFMETETGDIPKLSFEYEGLPGKGSALRSIMEAAHILESRCLVLLDSDLRSVRPHWVDLLARPILDGTASYITPFYQRHKYDGTITNHICYPLTCMLYNRKVRQPIGGDFGVSASMIERYIQKPEVVWETDVARFGIDIWMTTVALCEAELPIAQAALGAKIHDVKDPGKHLGPMFSQVVGTLFTMMEVYQSIWKANEDALEDVPIMGTIPEVELEPLVVDLDNLRSRSRTLFRQQKDFLLTHFDPAASQRWKSVEESGMIASADWLDLVFRFASLYRNHELRDGLIQSLVPIYYARVASFVEQTQDMDHDQAEAVVEEQARRARSMKKQLKEIWEMNC